MVTLYKLTDERAQTRNNTQWGEGIAHTTSGEGKLCGPGWLHAYTDPLLAILLNPIHAAFKTPRLWIAEGVVGITDGLKVGCTYLRTVHEIPLPQVLSAQRVYFAIACAKASGVAQPVWLAWAVGWVSGRDRSATAAGAAYLTAGCQPGVASCVTWAVDTSDPEASSWWTAQAAQEAAMMAGAGVVIDFLRLAHEAFEWQEGVTSC